MNKLIKSATIVTMDEKVGVIKEGYIAIADDVITYVGEILPMHFTPQLIIDGKGKVVLPGLINTHTHVPMVLLRSYADDLPLQEWLFKYIFPIEDKLTADDIYWASMLGIVEMLKSGITCFADMYFFMNKVAEAVDKTGIRANLSRGLQCFSDNFDAMRDVRLLENENLYKKWHGEGNGRIRVSVGPHSIYTCTPSYLEACVELAQRLGTGIHIHVSETIQENQDCLDKYGKTPVQHLCDLGVLDVNVLAAHCVHVTKEDMRILADKHVHIAYNPGSNLKLGSGIAPIRQMMESGLNISLGTDGASSNNNLNLFEEMYLTSVVTKGIEQNPTVLKARDVLRMATVSGAAALGIGDQVGTIKPGMKADLIIMNSSKPHYYPMHNIISNLVYSAQAADVETVMVDGEILLDKGELKTIDYQEVIYHISEINERIFE